MYCSTCGAYVPAGRSACSECGTQLALTARRPSSPAPRFGSEDRRWITESRLGVCPRCSYHGEGVSYFSRGRHVALLVGATLFTAGMMGIGGLAYYLVRRDHRSCPRCGSGWGRDGERSLVPVRGEALAHPRDSAPLGGRGGTRKHIGSIVLLVLAAMMLIGGIAGMEVGLVMAALVAATGGWFLRRAALEERAARRAALLATLQQPVLKLAAERQGRLTVTEVAAQMGWSLPRAEKVLESLNDGWRVDSEVTDEGVIVYDFRELRRSPGVSAPRVAGPRASEPGDLLADEE